METPFIIDIAEIGLKPGDFAEIESLGYLSELRLGETDISTIGPVKFKGRIQNTMTGIVFSAKLDVKLLLTCWRCLEEYEYPMAIEVTEFYAFPGHETEDEDVFIVKNDTIDIEPAIRDAVIFNIPIKHLCREDCRGICPECGKSLNEETCTCEPIKPDERWSALRDLFKE